MASRTAQPTTRRARGQPDLSEYSFRSLKYWIDVVFAFITYYAGYVTVFLLGCALWYLGARCTVLFFEMVLPASWLRWSGVPLLWVLPLGISVVEISFWRNGTKEHQGFYLGVAAFDILTTVLATMSYLRMRDALDLGSGVVIQLTTTIKVIVAMVAGLSFTFLPEFILRWAWQMITNRPPSKLFPNKDLYWEKIDPITTPRRAVQLDEEPVYEGEATFTPIEDDAYEDMDDFDPNEPIHLATGYIPQEYRMSQTRYERRKERGQ